MGPLEFNYPRAIAINAAEQFYVVDKGGHIQAVTVAAEFVCDWHVPNIQAGKPTGIGIGPDGRVYVADTHYSRVLIYSPEGELLEEHGENGTGPGQFIMPTDVAFGPDGSIYVSEYGGNDRVSKFSADWEFQLAIGGPEAGEARMQRPQTVVVADDGTLWVTDACNHRVCHFDDAGKLLGSVGSPGHAEGELWFPYGLDVLSDGTLVVCEFGNNRVQRLTPSGESLGIWGDAGRQPGQLAYPWAVVADSQDRVIIVDSGNNRLQIIAGRSKSTWYRTPR